MRARSVFRRARLLTATLLSLLLTTLLGCVTTPAFGPGYAPQAASADAAPDGPRVVLVHGIFDTSRQFDPIVKELEELGYDCFAPNLKPNSAAHGLRDLALKLQAEIDAEWGSKADFAIVAFSMGGLVARYYVQELGGAARCLALTTISTPHHGTFVAHTLPNQGAREMRPDSDFLNQLNSDASLARLREIPTYSYYTPLDAIIVPSTSSIWPPATNRRFWSLMHPLMLMDAPVREQLLADFEELFGERLPDSRKSPRQ